MVIRAPWRAMLVRICLTCILLLVLSPAYAAPNELQRLATAHFAANQGVFVETESGTVLVAQQESHPVHPASVTKVATTLALLERLGDKHRFDTRFVAGAPIVDGKLDGDLIVQADGDAFLIYENAFLMLRKLNAMGLHEVTGDIKVEGPLLFNWKPDPAGERLKRALQGLDGAEAWAAIGEAPARLKTVALRFDGKSSQPQPGKTLVTNHSPPLMTIVKALNGYSNNVFHLLSDRIGGPQAVEAIARKHLPAAMSSEVTITNAAGAEDLNRLSPRAAVGILWALRKQLRASGKDLPDALPVNGLDNGTLKKRLDDEAHRARIVGKTGTFGSVGSSDLVGVLHTKKYGDVAFAVLNSWLPVPEARERQDSFLRALIDATGAEPWAYKPDEKPPVEKASID
jgi:D-alanyl-D-alanine carboxypeptidase/D-alanyl-D-alanine-endopeptidase (penicillin-binding protein 4)